MKFRFLLVFILPLLLIGCAAPSIKRTRMEPPKIFLKDKTKLALMKVEGPWEAKGKINSGLTRDLTSRGHYQLMDISNDDQQQVGIPFDIKISKSGNVEIKGGQLPSAASDADVLMKVTVTKYRLNQTQGSESEKYYETIERDGKREEVTRYRQRPYIEQTGSAGFNVQLVDAKTRTFIASRDYEKDYYWKQFTDTSYHLEDRDSILEGLLDISVQNFVNDLYPQTVTDSLQFKKSDELVKPGVDLAKKGNYRGAQEEWERVAMTNPKNHEAQYNIGVVHFLFNELAEARKQFSTAYQLAPNQDYISALQLVDAIEGDKEKLKYW
ncbi:MAG TPA: tetratricopeptide repeat protein [Bdellovibrionota bacterium]|nr:tetratricopeptide repeat protein [Bdellovibrionota bacterium]